MILNVLNDRFFFFGISLLISKSDVGRRSCALGPGNEVTANQENSSIMTPVPLKKGKTMVSSII
jgi:hypothetical protein